jgi:branched-subunit amino acid ABC-type transport system permease component
MSGMVLGIINGVNVHNLSAIGLKVFPVVILGGLDSIGGPSSAASSSACWKPLPVDICHRR